MYKKIISSLFLGIFLSGFLILANYLPALADNYGLNDTAREVGAYSGQIDNATISENFIQTKSGQIIGVVLSFVGILFLILTIYAGLLWMTAQGNDQKVEKAKSLLTNAFIGLIIVFAAYAITAFIGDFVTNKMLN